MFGKKIKGKQLQKLIEALGGNYDSYFNRESGWDVRNLTGRLFVKPIEEGFNVKVAIKIGDVFTRYNLGTLTGVIPYSLKQNKLEAEVQN